MTEHLSLHLHTQGRCVTLDDFIESDHPRDKQGRWSVVGQASGPHRRTPFGRMIPQTAKIKQGTGLQHEGHVSFAWSNEGLKAKAQPFLGGIAASRADRKLIDSYVYNNARSENINTAMERALEKAPPIVNRLTSYRGVVLPPADVAQLEALKPGAVISLNRPSSFTSHLGTARSFARPNSKVYGVPTGSGESVLLKVSASPGTKGVAMAPFTFNMPNEHIWSGKTRYKKVHSYRTKQGLVVELEVVQPQVKTKDEFSESEHPRRKDGEFARKGAGQAKAATSAAISKAKQAPVVWKRHDGSLFAPHEVQRLVALKTPPAWQGLRLNADPSAKLQVTGIDAKGRVQRRYSAQHTAAATVTKFHRLKAFNAVAGKIMGSAQVDMFNHRLPPQQRDAAAVVKLIATTAFRIGSDRDTGADEKAYGASTLLKSHVKVGKSGDVSFEFVGKSGKVNAKTVHDAELARYIRGRKQTGTGDKLFDVPPTAVRKYLKEKGGAEFKVKDWRTWHGTNEALKVIDTLTLPTDSKSYAKFRAAVGKHVAAHLGNTPAVALASYIDPTVFARWSHLQ